MDLAKEQRIMLQKIWIVLKDRLVKFSGKTRSKDITIVDSLNNIGSDTIKLFLDCTEEEVNIATEFVVFVIDTVITTTSLQKTIDKVDELYQFSDI